MTRQVELNLSQTGLWPLHGRILGNCRNIVTLEGTNFGYYSRVVGGFLSKKYGTTHGRCTNDPATENAFSRRTMKINSAEFSASHLLPRFRQRRRLSALITHLV